MAANSGSFPLGRTILGTLIFIGLAYVFLAPSSPSTPPADVAVAENSSPWMVHVEVTAKRGVTLSAWDFYLLDANNTRYENYPGSAAMYGANPLPIHQDLNDGESVTGTLYFGLNDAAGPFRLVYDYGHGTTTFPLP